MARQVERSIEVDLRVEVGGRAPVRGMPPDNRPAPFRAKSPGEQRRLVALQGAPLVDREAVSGGADFSIGLRRGSGDADAKGIAYCRDRLRIGLARLDRAFNLAAQVKKMGR